MALPPVVVYSYSVRLYSRLSWLSQSALEQHCTVQTQAQTVICMCYNNAMSQLPRTHVQGVKQSVCLSVRRHHGRHEITISPHLGI